MTEIESIGAVGLERSRPRWLEGLAGVGRDCRLGILALATALVLTAGLLLAPPLLAAATTLKVTGSLWTPYLDGDLPEGGLASALVRTALTRAGYQIEPSIETWPRAYQGTALGLYDVVAAVWQNDQREQDLVFSKPYLLNDIVLLARRGVLVEFDTLEDLVGHRIGVVRDYAYDDGFDGYPGLTRIGNNHLLQNLLLLRQGKLDLIIGDKWSIYYQISQFMPDDLAAFRLLPKPVARRALRVGISRENPDAARIVEGFNAAVTAMKADGSYDQIVRRHTDGIAILPGKR